MSDNYSMAADVRVQSPGRPVFIIGAPRSGTSLLHRIMRGNPGFVSTAEEGWEIWKDYVHPELHGWRGELWIPDSLDGPALARLRKRIMRQAVPAALWRRVDASQVVEGRGGKRVPRPLLRMAYKGAVLGSRLTARLAGQDRLVEKSVHSGLWPDLLAAAFPDAAFVHIVRHPLPTIESIRRGWEHHGRFFTYELPIPLRVPGYSNRMWNFPLPEGWQAYVDQPLSAVAAFQWCRIQRSILAFLERTDQPWVRLRLEDLTADPRPEMSRLTDSLAIPWSHHLERMVASLPRVNASIGDGQSPRSLMETLTECGQADEVRGLAAEVGYDTDF